MNITDNLALLADDELLELIEAAQQVIARRAATSRIPEQIESLAREYRESGGDQAALVEAITEQEPQ